MSDTLTHTAPTSTSAARLPHDDVCRRCLSPGRCWSWDGQVRCEPCHRHIHGDTATDALILSNFAAYGEWWTDALFARADRYPTTDPQPEDPDA